jgi:hypothetical protein
MYGTHDYLANKAWDMLKDEAPGEADWIVQRYYFYGTELPDSSYMKESINDRNAQYLRFDEEGNLVDDMMAERSMRKYELAVNAFAVGGNGTASKWAGTIGAYIANAGLFSRVIEDAKNGLNFENFVNVRTDAGSEKAYPSPEFEELYAKYINFDGELEMISPYDAVVRVGRETYLGENGMCSAQWMDDNYDPEDAQFRQCAGQNFNNAINAMADVLHTLYQAGAKGADYELYAYDWENYFVEEPQPIVDDEPPHDTIILREPPEPPEEPDLIKIPPEPEEKDDRFEAAPWVILIAILLVVGIAFLNMKDSPKKKRVVKKRRSRKKKR